MQRGGGNAGSGGGGEDGGLDGDGGGGRGSGDDGCAGRGDGGGFGGVRSGGGQGKDGGSPGGNGGCGGRVGGRGGLSVCEAAISTALLRYADTECRRAETKPSVLFASACCVPTSAKQANMSAETRATMPLLLRRCKLWIGKNLSRGLESPASASPCPIFELGCQPTASACTASAARCSEGEGAPPCASAASSILKL